MFLLNLKFWKQIIYFFLSNYRTLIDEHLNHLHFPSLLQNRNHYFLIFLFRFYFDTPTQNFTCPWYEHSRHLSITIIFGNFHIYFHVFFFNVRKEKCFNFLTISCCKNGFYLYFYATTSCTLAHKIIFIYCFYCLFIYALPSSLLIK